MFNQSQKSKNSPQNRAVTILTEGCHFSGKLYCRGPSRIAGKIDGEIISEGLLVIEESAEIRAKITTEEAVVHGRIYGEMNSKNRVELTPTSYFEGDLETITLQIHEGAQFNGTSRMISKDSPKSEKNLSELSKFARERNQKSPGVDSHSLGKDKDIAAMSMPEVGAST